MSQVLKTQESECGAVVTQGRGKLVIVANWMKMDEETGFITQESVDSALKLISLGLRQQDFTHGRKEGDHLVTFAGDTIILIERIGVKAKKYNKQSADLAARQILEGFFKFATSQGYFDEVDPEKLCNSLELDLDKAKVGELGIKENASNDECEYEADQDESSLRIGEEP